MASKSFVNAKEDPVIYIVEWKSPVCILVEDVDVGTQIEWEMNGMSSTLFCEN